MGTCQTEIVAPTARGCLLGFPLNPSPQRMCTARGFSLPDSVLDFQPVPTVGALWFPCHPQVSQQYLKVSEADSFLDQKIQGTHIHCHLLAGHEQKQNATPSKLTACPFPGIHVSIHVGSVGSSLGRPPKVYPKGLDSGLWDHKGFYQPLL